MSKRNRRRNDRPLSRRPTATVSPRTIIFCKPYRVLSAFTDAEGRRALGDYIKVPDVYAAGRLDYDSEGLLLLTADGRLVHRITHPKYKLQKIYLVQVENIPDLNALRQLRRGVVLKGARTRPARVEMLPAQPTVFPRSTPIRSRKKIPTCWLKITLREGRKRQVRRMTALVGHPTLRLIRVAIGPIILGGLMPGHWRDLTPIEVRTLHDQLRRY
jgi:23S rRNA pseudouridine2457 synthase